MIEQQKEDRFWLYYSSICVLIVVLMIIGLGGMIYTSAVLGTAEGNSPTAWAPIVAAYPYNGDSVSVLDIITLNLHGTLYNMTLTCDFYKTGMNFPLQNYTSIQNLFWWNLKSDKPLQAYGAIHIGNFIYGIYSNQTVNGCTG